MTEKMKFGSLEMGVTNQSVGMGFGQYIGWNMGSVQNMDWEWDLYLAPFLDPLLYQIFRDFDQCMQEYSGHVPNFIAKCYINKSSLKLQQSHLTSIRMKNQ